MSEKTEVERRILRTLKRLHQQIEQQEQLLNEILFEMKKDPIPSPSRPPKSLSILENLELDTEKLTKIALFISSLYIDSDEDKVQSNRDE
ncbi:hypothetical protein JSQ81_07370 [Sporosarcina sp. Marseille-Q4063]|uniref:hypothetical protein n=1 Tax=Sporosarcina sp. Marseille-Q4063 TaxID=2810514 RepID=UPI001BB02510|nr:hypothetical protein [Sporosarcina sp. Marseille-Q4063]QUW23337.1 hypothetical protein JSQ81_07370 [Sporosarcina sp. Marseille-Q4063]